VVANLDYERTLFSRSVRRIVAIDEVGRGALAGPVTVGAVVVSPGSAECPAEIDDSKKLCSTKRAALVPRIHTWVDHFAVAHIEATRIDAVGITAALGEGARSAIDQLALSDIEQDTVLLLDGKHDFVSSHVPGLQVHTVIGGDGRCASIAGASILAKECRDALMRDLHERHPVYGWRTNVGYGTTEHRNAIERFGVTPQHRISWRLRPAVHKDRSGNPQEKTASAG